MAIRQRTFTIDKWLGVNESPDGDTGLKMGEATEMRNFKITKEGNLQIRPGFDEMVEIADTHPVRGLWNGYINGTEYLLSACNGKVYKHNTTTFAKTELGSMTDAATNFFAFGDKVYIQNGTEYYSYDGTTFGSVTGYVPITYIACAPATGSGTTLETVNKLTGSKIQWYSSPSGGATAFYLLEQAVDSVDYVYVDDVLQTITTDYTVNLTTGLVTFTSTVSEGTNNVKIQYTKGTGDRSTILSQKFCELFNGATDTRVCLYGDGTNRAYYSGIPYTTGLPSAEYFPDLNVLDIGDENTAITGMVRHFNKLMSFKPDGNGAYLTYYNTLSLTDGTTTAGFYTYPIDRDTGNDVYGQVKLVNNYPITLTNGAAYRWSLVYSSGTVDERSAKPISNRVSETMAGFTWDSVITFDDPFSREYWIHDTASDTTCIYSYVNETDYSASYKNNLWFIYTGIDATCFVLFNGEVYFGTSDGSLMKFSRDYRSDNGSNIDAYWESGSMSFDAEYLRKMANRHFLAMKPEANSRITMTLETDRKSDFTTKTVASNLFTFEHLDFSHLGFGTNYKPQVERIKLKAKKFTTMKLIFSSDSDTAVATILTYTVPVQYGSYAK